MVNYKKFFLISLEIGYAVAKGKPIYALSLEDPELYHQLLFRGSITSPANLVKQLK